MLRTYSAQLWKRPFLHEFLDEPDTPLRGVTLRILKHVDFWALVSVAILEGTGLPVVFFFSHK